MPDSTPNPKATVIFVLGGPGAGKGTMCANIVRDYNFVHLSAGDLLRAEQVKDTDNAKLIKSIINEGKIVPVEITANLLKNAMKEAIEKDNKSFFLVDGFPRNQDNWDGWNQVVGDFADVKFTLYLDCDEDTMERRLLGRAAESGNAVRSDDNIETIRKRFHTYVESTRPIIDMFAQMGKLHTIDSRPEPSKVYQQIVELFSNELSL